MPVQMIASSPPMFDRSESLLLGSGGTDALLIGIGLYLLAGLVVGGLGLLRMAPRGDPALHASGRSVRLLLFPGAVAVWPLAAWRWSRAAQATDRAAEGAGT